MRIRVGAILNPFRAMPHTTQNAQSASTLDAPMQKVKEREFDKFPEQSTFAFWKMNLRSEVCSGSCHPRTR